MAKNDIEADGAVYISNGKHPYFNKNITIDEDGNVTAINLIDPINDNDATNKSYVDNLKGKIEIVTSDPETADEGTMILNSTSDTIKIMYLEEWRILHTISITYSFILLETGDYILLETGDKIIKE